jgi:hypothetical protein
MFSPCRCCCCCCCCCCFCCSGVHCRVLADDHRLGAVCFLPRNEWRQCRATWGKGTLQCCMHSAGTLAVVAARPALGLPLAHAALLRPARACSTTCLPRAVAARCSMRPVGCSGCQVACSGLPAARRRSGGASCWVSSMLSGEIQRTCMPGLCTALLCCGLLCLQCGGFAVC